METLLRNRKEELQNEIPEIWFQLMDENFKPLDIYFQDHKKEQTLNGAQLDERGKKRNLLVFVPCPGFEPITVKEPKR